VADNEGQTASLQEHGKGHTVLGLGQCFVVIVVVWTTCCFAVGKWHWSEANAKTRLDLYSRSVGSGKYLPSHQAYCSTASRHHCMKFCDFPPQQVLYADGFYSLPQVLNVQKVKKINCNWIKTGAFHRASKKALWDYDFLTILIQNYISEQLL